MSWNTEQPAGNANVTPMGRRKPTKSNATTLLSGIWQGSNVQYPPASGIYHNHNAPELWPNFQETKLVPEAKKNLKPAFKLRKSIHPKPAPLLLNEMMAGKKPRYEYYDVPMKERERRAINSNKEIEEIGNFDCICFIDNDEYEGDGQTKIEAKNSAAETAIQGEIVRRCQLNGNKRVAEDFCPWPIIASLALSRMYDSWQLQGYTVPKELLSLPTDDHWSNPPLPGSSGGTNTWMDREASKGPLAKLNEMIARCELKTEFMLIDESGVPNDKNFCFRLTIGDVHMYSGQGKSKKTAKNNTAQEAINNSEVWYTPRPKRDRFANEETGQEEGTESMEIDY